MSSDLINVIAIVSLSLLGISLLILVISLIPLISQCVRLLATADEIAKSIRDQILPNIGELSDIIGKTNRIIRKGEHVGSRLKSSTQAVLCGLKAGMQSYFTKKK